MKIIMDSHEYEAAKAEQHLDGVHLYNEDGSLFVIITSPEAIKRVEDGEIVVVEQPEPTPSGDDSAVWDELDAAYQAGYSEGYTEGVNSAYDQ